MKRISLLNAFAILLLSSTSVLGQLAGLNTSNWAGVAAVSQNPAIADNRYIADVSLGAFSMAAANNTSGVSYKHIFFNTIFNQSNNSGFFGDNLFTDMSGSLRSPSVFKATKRAQIQGPGSFLFSFGKKNRNAIAVSYHINYLKSSNTGNVDFFNYAANFASETALPFDKKVFLNQSFNSTAIAWADYGITYSRVLFDNGINLLKAGATLKVLHGLGAAFVAVDNANITFYNKYKTVYFNNTSVKYSRTEQFSTNELKFRNVAGLTAGADIGFVYEWRPKISSYTYTMDGKKGLRPRDMDLHRIAVGFSITDIGVINFKRVPGSGNFVLDGYYTSNDELNDNYSISNALTFDAFLGKYAKPDAKTPEKFKVVLPMRINGFMDINIIKGFGVNIAARIYPKMSEKLVFAQDVTTFTITPRYDITWFGAYLPISYDVYNNANLGLGLRLGPVNIGTQNLLGFFMNKGVYNGDVYATVHVPIPHTRPRDKDRDKVSNRKDVCPEIPGTFETRGCPDNDKDGIDNLIDKCPDDFGPIELNGCPDSDGDSVIDKNDSCPQIKGLVQFAGCPDMDEDGIPDRLDACPKIFGPKETQGCPDRDSDGVPDREDDCPDDVGIKAHRGCPDTDKDGVPDIEDKCPTKKGDPDHHGCPDTDGDLVFDDEDLDINNPGLIENRGAPDTDTDSDDDGVPDIEDKCPWEKGEKLYKGCKRPQQSKPLVGESLYDYLIFEEDDHEISPVSKQVLRQFAAGKINELNTTSGQSWVIMLKGYADKREGISEEDRESLSEKRMRKVSDYLISLGIPAEIIQGTFVGSSESVAPSDIESNRRKNRSVSITQVFAK
jgi:outer membrane protein OmpA-like peptidoglycan-associated protein